MRFTIEPGDMGHDFHIGWLAWILGQPRPEGEGVAVEGARCGWDTAANTHSASVVNWSQAPGLIEALQEMVRRGQIQVELEGRGAPLRAPAEAHPPDRPDLIERVVAALRAGW